MERLQRILAHGDAAGLEPVQSVDAVVEHQDAPGVARISVEAARGQRLGVLIRVGHARRAGPRRGRP